MALKQLALESFFDQGEEPTKETPEGTQRDSKNKGAFKKISRDLLKLLFNHNR